MNALFKGLLEEINFWQIMLLESGVAVESQEYQKMEKALMLAQMKLADILEDSVDTVSDISTSTIH